MKKVKYRAYNYIIDSIYKVKSIDWDDIGNLYHINGITVDPTQVTLMQFTGLHDKNGVEIYEGDIVTAEECSFYDPTGTIKWDKDTARFIIDFDNERIIWDFDNTYSFELEVVGNIFNNPELLGSGE